MTIPHLGEVFSLLAALIWALSVVLFRLSGRRYSPSELNFFKNIVALLLLLLTFVVLGQDFFHPAPLKDYLVLLLSGILGIAVADTLFFRSLNIVGAGLSQIVSLSYSPFVILFAFSFLGERLTVWDLTGAALILAGILLTTKREQEHDLTKHELRAGITLATLAVAINALGITIAKPVLGNFPVMWATFVRLVGGVVALMLLSAFVPRYRRLWRTLRPSPTWKLAIPSAVLGAYLGMLVWIGGMKYTQASTASILNQTSAIFVLPIAAIILHERITPRKIGAVVLAILGVVMVTLA